MTEVCEYCKRPIDTRGIDSHVYHKHRAEVRARFRTNPQVQTYLAVSAILLAARGEGPKLLKASPVWIETLLMQRDEIESRLINLMLEHFVTLADIAAARIPEPCYQVLRALAAFERRLMDMWIYGEVWRVPVWPSLRGHLLGIPTASELDEALKVAPGPALDRMVSAMVQTEVRPYSTDESHANFVVKHLAAEGITIHVSPPRNRSRWAADSNGHGDLSTCYGSTRAHVISRIAICSLVIKYGNVLGAMNYYRPLVKR